MSPRNEHKRYALRPRSGSSNRPSQSVGDPPPTLQSNSVGEALGTLHASSHHDDGSRTQRVWNLTADTDVGRKETDNEEWMIKKVTLDHNDVPCHRVEQGSLPHDTTFWVDDVAEGHHTYTEEYDGWTFHGVNLNSGQAPSSANQQVIASTEADSVVGGSRAK